MLALKARMEGKGNPKNIQNQLCHSPTVKAITQSWVERQDSQTAGDHCSLRGFEASPPIPAAAQDGMTRVSSLGIRSGLKHLLVVEAPESFAAIAGVRQTGLHMRKLL